MDTTQLLLIIIITITTLLMIIIGIQLIFLIKEIRSTIKKIVYFIDDNNIKNDKINKQNHKHLIEKKQTTLYNVLNKINFFSPKSSFKSKKLFVKEKKIIWL